MTLHSRRRVLVCAFAVLVAGGLWGCNAFDGSLLPSDAGLPDTGPADSGPYDGGPSRQPPPRPTVGDGPDMFPTLDFFLKDVVLKQDGDAWRGIGFDLDHLVSQGDMPVVECVPPKRTARPELDGDEGIDNAFGHVLFPLVNLVVPDIDMTARQSEQEGLGAIAVRIRGYNGLADDPRVDVTVAQTVVGTTGGPDDTMPPAIDINDFVAYLPDGSTAPLPAWDGNDWFWVREESFAAGDETRPRIQDNNAYVADHQLVMHLPDGVEIVLPGPMQGVTAVLTNGLVVGRIADDFTSFGPVVVGGRWPVNALLETAQALGVCVGDTQFTILTQQLDTIADIRATPGTGGADVPCDAISIGVTFMGFLGRWAALTPGQPLPNQCELRMMDCGVSDASTPTDAGTDAGVDAGG